MSLLKIRIARIRETSEIIAQPGYLEDYLKAGTVTPCGKFLMVPPEARAAIRAKYQPRGLGDRIAMLAKPTARILKAVTGGRLDYTNCKRCDQEQAALNAQFPAKAPKPTL